MNGSFDSSEQTIGVQIRLLVDRLCDTAEARLKRQEKVDWNHLFAQIDKAYWPFFVKCLLPQVNQITGRQVRGQIADLFDGTDSAILQVIEQFNEQTNAANDYTTNPHQENYLVADDGEALPHEIDHFKIIRQIGRGGFGTVLLAHDQHLDREVVIKLPREKTFQSHEWLASFMGEARKIAMLEHPGIVRIHHVGVWQSRPYLVQQYVIGGDLKQAIRSRKLTFREISEIVAKVAETIAFAHKLRIVHRDLKPANILLDDLGRPLVADFGLAIHESEQFGKGGIVAGTAPYMAPEQLRGEVHRLDGRTDIWSLGVCMYLMLTEQLPFQADDTATFRNLVNQQPCRPPRQLAPNIPWELERICIKCLSKRMDDRYATGVDLANDLKDWLSSPSSHEPGLTNAFTDNRASWVEQKESLDTAIPGQINFDSNSLPMVPKGLLPFEQRDHHSYLKFVPGPKNRYGIPEQLNFWAAKISDCGPDEVFSVGLIYGPSGCGKSSFVRAGLLPLLPQQIAVVYIESTDTDTEVRLLVGLRKLFPEIPRDQDLPQIFSQLRMGKWLGKYQKILLVFDQFEQWLHVNEVSLANQLLEAMRHCDGVTLQALVLARDDFWMKVSRFFQELEIPLEERRNYQPLYLFDIEHAKQVLIDFGKAYGCLPNQGDLNDQQRRFVEMAVEQLADKQKIVCVHLVLLVETLRDKPWTVATLKEMGSINHIGTRFLEQQFSSDQANPSHRALLKGIARALEFLLPDEDANIKARFRSLKRISDMSGYPLDSKPFINMMNVLEKQLRIISAADPDQGSHDLHHPSDSEAKYYQLSHDFLVPSVRGWLANLQRQTPSARTLAKLESLAKSYHISQDQRYLPSFWECVELVRYVRPRECSPEARHLYGRAVKKYAGRMTSIAACLLVVLSLWWWNARSGARRLAEVRIQQWLDAKPEELSVATMLIDDRPPLMDWLMQRMSEQGQLANADTVRLNLGLALNGTADTERLEFLIDYLPNAKYEELPTFRKAFQRYGTVVEKQIENKLKAADASEQRIKLAIVLFNLRISEPLLSMLNPGSDPGLSLLAIRGVGDDRDTIEKYLECLKRSNDNAEMHDSLAGMLCGLLLRWEDKLNGAQRQALASICAELVETSPNSFMHATAQAVLQKWPVDSIPKTVPPGEKVLEKDWWVAPNGLTLVRVRAEGVEINGENAKLKNVQTQYEGEKLTDFWISSKEVSSALYSRFAREAEKRNLFSRPWEGPQDDHPVTGVLPHDAMHFCNWLSDQEGLEHCYVRTDRAYELKNHEQQVFGQLQIEGPWKNYKQWVVEPNKDGYRLPSIGESVFLLKEEVNRFKNLADKRKMFQDYAWFADNTDLSGVVPGGQLLPNHRGLFDLLGNAAELAIDTRHRDIRLEHVITSSSTQSSSSELASATHVGTLLWIRSKHTSFRVVRGRLPREKQ